MFVKILAFAVIVTVVHNEFGRTYAFPTNTEIDDQITDVRDHSLRSTNIIRRGYQNYVKQTHLAFNRKNANALPKGRIAVEQSNPTIQLADQQNDYDDDYVQPEPASSTTYAPRKPQRRVSEPVIPISTPIHEKYTTAYPQNRVVDITLNRMPNIFSRSNTPRNSPSNLEIQNDRTNIENKRRRNDQAYNRSNPVSLINTTIPPSDNTTPVPSGSSQNIATNFRATRPTKTFTTTTKSPDVLIDQIFGGFTVPPTSTATSSKPALPPAAVLPSDSDQTEDEYDDEESGLGTRIDQFALKSLING